MIKNMNYIKQFVIAQGMLIATIGALANHSNSSATLVKRDTISDNKNKVDKTVLTESLISFNAEYMSHSIDLRWNIANGKRYTHFVVERSLDGNNFEKVGEVNAIANASATQDYSYTDYVKPVVARKNDLYYRLKQTDETNASVYSKVLIVRMYNTKSVTAVSVTPDPTVNDILVNTQLKENSFVAMTVKDKDGGLIIKKTAHAQIGANSFSIDGTSNLKPGTYQLEVIINSNERLTMQLIKS
jgi:hypothetical protein